jgi:hypothetical protein
MRWAVGLQDSLCGTRHQAGVYISGSPSEKEEQGGLKCVSSSVVPSSSWNSCSSPQTLVPTSTTLETCWIMAIRDFLHAQHTHGIHCYSHPHPCAKVTGLPWYCDFEELLSSQLEKLNACRPFSYEFPGCRRSLPLTVKSSPAIPSDGNDRSSSLTK